MKLHPLISPPVAAAFLAFGLSSISQGQSVIFQPDFAGTHTGGGANQFTDQYQAESGTYSTLLIVETNQFQFQSNHNPALNTGPAEQGWNHSAAQLSRNRDSAALPFVSNVGIVEFNWRWNDNVWASGDQSILNFQIGENFRNGAFNPSGGNGGPAFASLSLQARTTDGQFRFISGGGPGSTAFNLTRDGDGFFNASIVLAFNNSGATQSLSSVPGGPYDLNSGAYSAWVNTTLVWNNNVSNIGAAAFENIAFGFGTGNNRTFDEAEPFGGTTQLYDVSVSTIPEPSAFAALAGLAVLGLAATRRRRA